MKRLFSILMAISLLFSCAGAEKVLYVQGQTSDRVHLRAEASANAKSLGLYFTGTAAVQLSEAVNGWVKVSIGKETGYIHQAYLSDADYVPSVAPEYVVSNPHSTWVNLRSAPSTKSEALAQYDNGTPVFLLGETADGWSYVKTDLLMGYMMTEMISHAGHQFVWGFNSADEIAAQTTIVGQTRENDWIHHYVADNGQDIFFPAIEERPTITKHDVNSDGQQDLVIYTAMGASCLFCRFYVYNGGMYTLVTQNGMAVELCNYELYPGKQLVFSSANNGYAGALFEKEIYRWTNDGTQLQLVRRAVSDDLTETEWVMGEKYTTTTWLNKLHVKVFDFTTDEPNGTLVWEGKNATEQIDSAWFDQIDNILWQGL